MRRFLRWLGGAGLVWVLVLLTLTPVALLTFLSLRLATDAVSNEVEARVSSAATLSGEVVRQEVLGLGDVVESYADRPSLIGALRNSPDHDVIRFHLDELQRSDNIAVAFVTDPRGDLLDIVPATPSIVGRNFAFRDWYRGVRLTQRVYVSEAYETAATGNARVVAVATPIRDGRRLLGILVAAYDLGHIHRFTAEFARAQHVLLKVTDQRGVLLAQPGTLPQQGLVSRIGDPRVRAALEGRAGVTELDTPDGSRLSAYAPIAELGWTITASVPANTAYAAIGDLRSTVLTIAGLLGILLIAGLIMFARALKARRLAEQAADRQAGINAAVLEAETDGICLVDREGRVALANNVFERLVSDIIAEPAELVARRRPMAEIGALIAGRTTDPDSYRAALGKITDDEDHVAVDEYELAASGRSFQRHAAPVRDHEGELIGRLLVLREVTAERESERLKSELVATVSHELRTPLTGILGFAELVRTADLDEEKRNRYLDTIHHEAQRLTALVNDFLDLQRMEAGAFTLAVEPLDFAEVLAWQAELAQGPAADHEIRLELPNELLPIAGDRERIGQVVGNLISNAIKYSPRGGVVTIAAAHEDGVIRVSVSDEGVGIPVNQQQQIFTKFFRVDSSDTRSIGGTGLGLALCREIVESHGGRIGFDSAPGAGSTFWFTLPAPRLTHGLASRRVLIVEDDPAAAEFLAACLAEDGLETEIVRTGEAALERAIADPPAVICLDMRLAGRIDGWNVLERVKATPATARIPVIVCTGNNGRSRAAALGAADFLAKPFRADVLRDAVHRVLPGTKGNVLVVDDDQTMRRLVVETLADNGFKLAEAADGAEALAAIAEATPDAIVLDLFMPNMDGFEVLEHLQNRPETRAVPVIVLTAHRLNAEQRSVLAVRTVALLEKSMYSADELRTLVTRAAGLTSVG